jgi:hypothetical protein
MKHVIEGSYRMINVSPFTSIINMKEMEVLLNIKDGDWTIPIFLALEMKPNKG